VTETGRPEDGLEEATFGAGCFWHVELAFSGVPGVVSTRVGYSGGWNEDPKYEDVCTGGTGHAEVVRVEFDPKVIIYSALLEVFWSIHDPTTLNRQGPDIGTQYRSVIFYHTEEQRAAAEASKKALEESGAFADAIVTEIEPAAVFYPAEEYHQKYLEKTGRSSC